MSSLLTCLELEEQAHFGSASMCFPFGTGSLFTPTRARSARGRLGLLQCATTPQYSPVLLKQEQARTVTQSCVSATITAHLCAAGGTTWCSSFACSVLPSAWSSSPICSVQSRHSAFGSAVLTWTVQQADSHHAVFRREKASTYGTQQGQDTTHIQITVICRDRGVHAHAHTV